MGSLLPFAAETAKVRYGPGTFTMPLFARDFAKFTICALLPFVQVRTSRQLSVFYMWGIMWGKSETMTFYK
jgi:hypothetical protein